MSLRTSEKVSARTLRRQKWAKAVFLARQAANRGEHVRIDLSRDEDPEAQARSSRKRARAGSHDDGPWHRRRTHYGGDDDQQGHRWGRYEGDQQEEAEAPRREAVGYKLGLAGEPPLPQMHPSWRVRRVAAAKQHVYLQSVFAPATNRKERRMAQRRGVAMSHSRTYLAFDDEGQVVESKSCRVNQRALAVQAKLDEKAAKAAAKNALRKRGHRWRKQQAREKARLAEAAEASQADDAAPAVDGEGGGGDSAGRCATDASVATSGQETSENNM